MKALTIQQPYAWAVANGHKTVENRTGPAWKYRGPIAIHAGARLSSRGMTDPLVVAAMVRQYAWPEPDWTPRPGFTVVPGRLGLWELPQQVALDVAGRAGEVLGGAQVIPRALAAGAS